MSLRRARRNPWVTVVVTCMGLFMIMLDATVVIVTAPSMLVGLHATIDQVLWVFNGYLLAYVVLLVTAGRLGDVFGPRTVFSVGLLLFTAASALCGLSHEADQLIAARVLQGIGAALIAPQPLAILTAIFPPQRRGAALGAWGGVVGISLISGPVVGGLVVTYLGWPWIFFLNIPVGLLTLTAALLVVPDLRLGRAHRFDVPGVLLASVGLFFVVYGLIEGQPNQWGAIGGGIFTIPEVLALGAVVLVVFLLCEAFQTEPLLPLSLFRQRDFSLMNLIGPAVQFGIQGVFIPITLFTQSVLGWSAIKSGLTLLPAALAAAVLSPLAGRLSDRTGGKYLLLAGILVFALGIAWVGWAAELDSNAFSFTIPLMVVGLGLGLSFAPATTIAMRQIKPEEAGAASGVLNTTRQLGAVLGAAVVGAVLQNRLGAELIEQAAAYSLQLPPQLREPFLAAFKHTSGAGPQPGPTLAGQPLSALAHEVFAHAYLPAVKPTVYMAAAVVAVIAFTCLRVTGSRSAALAEAQVPASAVIDS